VLITLAIIGIIAAITIPSIVANHQKRTLETQFAKMYRTLQQVVNLAVAEHGDISTWDFINGQATDEQKVAFIEKYFLPYLNVAKFCAQDGHECFSEKYKLKNGNNWNPSSTAVVLADGTMINIYFNPNNCIDNKSNCVNFNPDINGVKKPNTFGLDLFTFQFIPATGEFLPQGSKKTYEEIKTACKSGTSGVECGALIILDGFKMNY